MGKFLKRKSNNTKKDRRTKKGILSGLNNLFKTIGKPAGLILFNQIWECKDLTKLEISSKGIRKKIVRKITSKYKHQMLGYKYQLIYLHLEKLIEGLKDKNYYSENYVLVKKDLISFYKKPLSYDPDNNYPLYRKELSTIFVSIEKEKVKKYQVRYLEKIILPDLKSCEFLQKTSFLEMWGLA